MSRQAIREELADLMEATTAFNVVYAYPPTDIKQADKAIAVYATGTEQDIITADMTNDLHSFTLDVYVRRDDSETSEDTFDGLYNTVRGVLNTAATTANANWSALMVSGPSECLFAVISGKPYRVERFNLIVKETL